MHREGENGRNRMKNLENMDNFDLKELRGLRIKLNNRIKSLESFGKPKDLQPSHILYGKELQECKDLLDEVKRAEKKLIKG